MEDYTTREDYKNRPFSIMYYADEDNLSVDQVQAFHCSQNDPDELRWVPEKGYSVSVGGFVFNAFEPALEKLRVKAYAERTRLEGRIKRIDAFLRGE